MNQLLPMARTLHVDDQQGVTDGERRPEAHGLRGGQEVPVDEGHGGQVAHYKGHGQGAAQQPGEVVRARQQAQADPTVALAAVQLVALADVVAEAPGTRAEQRCQPQAQHQVQRAVRSALLQEAQAADQPAAQRVLAQQVQLQLLGALGALGGWGDNDGGLGCSSSWGDPEGVTVQMLHSVGGWSLKEPQGLFPKRKYCLQVKPTGIVSFVFLNLFLGQVMKACVIFSSLTKD